jgi:hypothetical protein
MHVLRIKYSAIVHYINVDRSLRRVAQIYGEGKVLCSDGLQLTNLPQTSNISRKHKSLYNTCCLEVEALIINDPYSSLSMVQPRS